tara:strand:+ start:656 stop:1912 length:1257 start_codon:yes stop_codon:yes gene_type:complete
MVQIMTAAEAKKLILENTSVIDATEEVELKNSLGRACAKNIISPINVPNHINSAMDGYAINLDNARERQTSASLWDRVPEKIKIIGKATAGNPYSGNFNQNAAIQIMTGAVVPKGYDTVVINEDVSVSNGNLIIKEFPNKGDNIREAGEDLEKGEACINKHKMLTAADLGLLASIGISKINVFRKPKVAIFSTGDEIKNPNESLSIGQIYDSNRFSLAGMLQKIGVEIIDLGIIPDDPIMLKERLGNASSSSDVLITTGGVSVGERDYMKAVLNEIGKIFFWKIKIKPGRPFTFGNIDECMYFGLPGNPVSSMVTFSQFVMPSLIKLSGSTPQETFFLPAKAAVAIRKIKGRTEYQRGTYEKKQNGSFWVKPTANQGSGILNSMSRANCIIHLTDELSDIKIGGSVLIEPFMANKVLN